MNQYRNDELLTGIAIIAKQLREKLGLSQEEVVNDIKIKTGISIHIGRIETAVGNISVSNLSLLCEYYNIPLSKFMVKIEEAMKKKDFPNLSRLIGVKVIHISERDTQITDKVKQPNEFLNTWSIDGFHGEMKLFSEMGWGTHEKQEPKEAMRFSFGTQNILVLPTKGIKTKARSWVPSGPIIGYVITHDEAFSLSRYLTIKESNTTNHLNIY